MSAAPARERVTDDMPLRLDVAAQMAFADGSISASSLRKEAARGRLTVWRIAGKDMTTLAEIRNMVERCRVNQPRPDSGSGQPAPHSQPRGLSSIEESNAARAARQMRASKLREPSQNTLGKSTTPRQAGIVLPMKS